MPFQDARDAEKRLVNPQPLTDEEITELLPWMQLLSTGSHARLQAHLGISNVRAIRALNETSATIEGAVRRMDEGSTKLAIKGLRLNLALFVLTIIGIVLSAIAVWIALKTYRDANASAAEQQKTLDASRQSLETTVQSLNRLTALSEEQLNQWEKYQKQAMAKPDFALDFVSLFQATKVVRKFKLQTSIEYKVPYGRDLVFSAIVRNVTHTPAHNIRILLGIGMSGNVENFTFLTPLMNEVPAAMPGWRLFQRDEAVLYPGDWHVEYTARIKADALDNSTQMFISVQGSDLTHRYEQWAALRKLSQ